MSRFRRNTGELKWQAESAVCSAFAILVLVGLYWVGAGGIAVLGAIATSLAVQWWLWRKGLVAPRYRRFVNDWPDPAR